MGKNKGLYGIFLVFLIFCLAFVSADLPANAFYKQFLDGSQNGILTSSGSETNLGTDIFTGSLIFSYPLTLPDSVLTPSVVLSYNSQSTKGKPGFLGSSWVLNENYIQRNIEYTRNVISDDTFELNFNGAKYNLVYDPSEDRYHTEIESYFYIKKISGGSNTNGEYWILKTVDGTEYRFGYNLDSEQVSNQESYTTKWYLDKVIDTYNNDIFYSYLENPNSEDSGVTYPYKIEYGKDKINSVEFILESSNRQDFWEYYEQGNLISLSRRISDIITYVNGSQVKKYSFDYEYLEITKSFLHSISIYGRNNSFLSSENFTYNNLDKGWTLGLWDSPSISYLGGTFFEDVNRDGFVDVINSNMEMSSSWETDSSYGTSNVYLNNKQNGWVSSSLTVPYSNTLNFRDDDTCDYSILNNFAERGLRFIDLNQDGFVDAIFHPENYYVDRGLSFKATIFNGVSWTDTSSLIPGVGSILNFDQDYDFCNDYEPGNTPIQIGIDKGMRFLDFNGDGNLDIIKGSTRLLNLNTWTSTTNWVFSEDMGLSSSKSVDYDCSRWGGIDYGVRFIDINGDGLSDVLVSRDVYSGTDVKKVLINNGVGFVQDSSWSIPVYFVKDDIWGGEYQCLTRFGVDQGVRFSDVNNDGLVDIIQGYTSKNVYINNGHGWQLDNAWNFPLSFVVDLSSGRGQTQGAVMTDVNGDGSVDVANNAGNSWINNAPKSYLLKTITNSLGGVISIDYEKSTMFDNTGDDDISDLGFNVWVVSNITKNNGVVGSHNVISVLEYDYSGGMYDYGDREFRGFNYVVEKIDNKTIKHWFYQDDVTKGREYKTEVYGDDILFLQTFNTWSYQDFGNYYVINLDQNSEILFDGLISKNRTSKYIYDSYGNRLVIHEFGDVDVLDDDIYTYNEYLYDDASWIVDRVKTVKILNDFSKLSEINYSYDGFSYGVIPTKGSVTQKIIWNNNGADKILNYTYDLFGNLESETDALGNTVNYIYDSTGTFLLKMIDALGFVTEYQYDFELGKLLFVKDSFGNYVNYTYDEFGRILKEIQVYDSVVYPTKSYSYNFDGTAPEELELNIKKQNDTFDIFVFYDGFGNTIQEKIESRNNKQIVRDVFYDSNYRVVRKSNPYYVDFFEGYSTPLSVSHSEISYDILDRILFEINPDGTYRENNYGLWNISRFDENRNQIDLIMDAYGNTIEIIEHNGDIYSTLYDYDSLGNLIEIVDNENNVFEFVYDSLGRRVSETDPDLGLIEYGYDLNGNLIWEKRARGGLLTDGSLVQSYNELGQLVNVTYSDGELVENYVYDGTGKRIKIYNALKDEITYTPFDEFMMIVNSSGTYNYTYVYQDGILVARINPDGSKWFYHPDNIGSTSLITDDAGLVIENVSYYPYGSVISSVGFENKLYENKELDSTGLYYYGARYYDPSTRLFVSADTLLPNVYDPQQLNKYMFERGNPYRYTDPSGGVPVPIATGSIGGIIGWFTGAGVSAYTQYRDTGSIDIQQVGKDSLIGAAAGFVAGATFGLASPIIGQVANAGGVIRAAPLVATAGGLSSVAGGQTAVAMDNILSGNPATQGLGDPKQMGGDFLLGAGASLASYGVSVAAHSVSTSKGIFRPTPHASYQMQTRGISSSEVQFTIENNNGFIRPYKGNLQMAFYDPKTKLFVPTNDGNIKTVFKSRPTYVDVR